MEERKYPIGIQTFSEIIQGKYIYVDKTNYVYQLAQNYKYVFLSRPRRFGKSLLSSTLQSYFEGRKELFKGLAIDSLEKNWVKHPVLSFDLSSIKSLNVNEIRGSIGNSLDFYEKRYGLDGSNLGLNDRLGNLIRSACEQTGEKAVVIIDEYDSALLEVMHDTERLAEVRQLLRNFYSPLKGCDAYLRFVFITGITKFAQMSIFFELNNLVNISMMPEYSGICGITKTELHAQFVPDIQVLAEAYDCTADEVKEKLRENYDGYHFSDKSDDIYNPFSILYAFAAKRIESYYLCVRNEIRRLGRGCPEAD